MTEPVSSVGRAGSSRRVRNRRAQEARAADPSASAAGPEAVAPIPPRPGDPDMTPPVVSAHILGQSDAAESDPLPAKKAQKAHTAYLKVEWSGPADRRNPRGRIAKTKV